MSMPRHSSSYEAIFHTLFTVLGDPSRRKDTELPFEDAKKAGAFRLRYYSFMRVIDKEIKATLSNRNAHPDTLKEAMAKLDQLKRARRFKAVLNSNTVIFTDRDIPFENLSNKILEDFIEEQAQQSIEAQTQLNAQPKHKDAGEQLFEDYLNSKTDAQAQTQPEPYDPLREETKEPPTGIKPDTLINNTITRLRHGTSETISLPFDSPSAAQAFHNQWTTHNHADTPPHTIQLDDRRVIITRATTAE